VGLPDRRSSDELGFDELAGDEPGEPVEHEVGTVPLPARSDAGWLWRVLVLGLVVILAVSLAGIIWTVGDGNDRTSPDVIVTIFSSTLAGLIGLFVRAPA
jgi:hypothetical protein